MSITMSSSPHNAAIDEPSRRVDRALDELGPLPVLGGTVAEVRAAAADPAVTTDALVAIIERDEAFAANLLRFTGSAAFARRFPPQTARQAVMLVGRKRLGRLALEAVTYRFLERVPGAGGISRGQMHLHALAVARTAEAAAMMADVDRETVHLAALLHDVGKLVMPRAFGETALEELARERPSGVGRAELERARFGIDHAEVGARLAQRSGASDEVTEAIAFHHGGPGGDCVPGKVAACVQIADAVVGMAAGLEPNTVVAEAALDVLGLTDAAIEELAQTGLGQSAPDADAGPGRVVELERLAHTDELTGIPNRRAFQARMREELGAGQAGTLLLVDVDFFKTLNDDHGHAVGDLVLSHLARILARHGFAARLGGDEFAVWHAGSRVEGERAGEAIVTAVATELSRPDLPISVSVGVAHAELAGDVQELLRVADGALYAAKTGGRGRSLSASVA